MIAGHTSQSSLDRRGLQRVCYNLLEGKCLRTFCPICGRPGIRNRILRYYTSNAMVASLRHSWGLTRAFTCWMHKHEEGTLHVETLTRRSMTVGQNLNELQLGTFSLRQSPLFGSPSSSAAQRSHFKLIHTHLLNLKRTYTRRKL